MNVALALAVHTNLAHGLSQGVVVREDGPAVTIAAQGFAGEKTGATDGAEVATLAAFVGGAEALGGVFNDRQVAVFGRDGVDGVHVGSLAVQAHRHDGFGSRGDGRFNQVGVDVAGVRLHVHEHGLGPQEHNHFGRGHKGKRRGDDFIARANAQRHQAHE